MADLKMSQLPLKASVVETDQIMLLSGGVNARTTVGVLLQDVQPIEEGDFAPINSPGFTGVPTAPTAGVGSQTAQLATTNFVTRADNLKADLLSPAFSGIPTAPTAALGTNNAQIATTAYVIANSGNVGNFAPINSPAFTGVPTAPAPSAGANSTQIATTSFVTAANALKAPLANPVFTGVPSAPTAVLGTNTSQLATTAFVIANAGGDGGGTASAMFANIAAAKAASIPFDVRTIVTACYDTQGYGGAIYNRLPGKPNPYLMIDPDTGTVSVGCFRSADRYKSTAVNDADIDTTNGGYWMLDISTQRVNVHMFGARGDSPPTVAGEASYDGDGIRWAHFFCRWARYSDNINYQRFDKTAPVGGATATPYIQYVPLHFPMGRYNINAGQALPMVDHMKWVGEGQHADETNFVPMVRMSADNIFYLQPPGPDDPGDPNAPLDRVDWVSIKNMAFDGRNQRFCFLRPTSITNVNDMKLFHSTFESCGFKNFNIPFCNLLSGVMIRYCYFQNNHCAMKVAGADNIIENNYISGSNWRTQADPESIKLPSRPNSYGYNPITGGDPTKPAGPTNTGIMPADQSTFAVELGSFRLSRFNRNYITGMPQMCLKVSGSLDGTILEQNWFDYADWSLVFIENSRGGLFLGNTFNNGMLGIDPTTFATPAGKSRTNTTSTTYNALIRIANNSHHFTFANSIFGWYEALTSQDRKPLNNTYHPPTFSITGGQDIMTAPPAVLIGHCNNIQIHGSTYGSDYKFSMSYDPLSGPPSILERGGSGNTSRFPYGRTAIFGYTDCMNVFPGSGDGTWGASLGGGVVTPANVQSWSDANPGVVRLNLTNGAPPTWVAIRTGIKQIRFSGGEARCYIVLKEAFAPDGVNLIRVVAGFADGFETTPASNGAFFRFTSGVNGNRWEAVVVSTDPSNEVVKDTGISYSTGIRKFTVVVDDAGENAYFYANVTVGTSLPDLVAHIGTLASPANPIGTFPIIAGREVGVGVGAVKTAGTTANVNALDLDYLEFEQRLLSQR